MTSRNWSYRGDKGTWAKYDEDTNTLTVKRAQGGIISSAYENEMEALCGLFGIDWHSVRCGETATGTIIVETEAEAEENIILTLAENAAVNGIELTDLFCEYRNVMAAEIDEDANISYSADGETNWMWGHRRTDR